MDDEGKLSALPPRRTWGSAADEHRRPSPKPLPIGWAIAAGLSAFVIGMGLTHPEFYPRLSPGSETAGPRSPVGDSVHFELCGFQRFNCVVDGDTIWLQGHKIRIADIDAPEKSEPKCDSEYQLAMKATYRLRDLLNLGPFVVQPIGDRDKDKYGRDLRVLTRDGQSLGDALVSEGLARTWTGRREPWC